MAKKYVSAEISINNMPVTFDCSFNNTTTNILITPAKTSDESEAFIALLINNKSQTEEVFTKNYFSVQVLGKENTDIFTAKLLSHARKIAGIATNMHKKFNGMDVIFNYKASENSIAVSITPQSFYNKHGNDAEPMSVYTLNTTTGNEKYEVNEDTLKYKLKVSDEDLFFYNVHKNASKIAKLAAE